MVPPSAVYLKNAAERRPRGGIPMIVEVTLVALAMLAIKGVALFAIVYLGARMAIRHERRLSD